MTIIKERELTADTKGVRLSTLLWDQWRKARAEESVAKEELGKASRF